MRALITIVISLAAFAGCTTWSSTTSFGSPQEVARRLKGSPSFATSSSTAVAGGFVGASTGNALVAGFGAGSQSVTRTRCVQDVDVAYEQTYEIHPIEIGRSKDKLAGIALGVAGLLFISAGIEAESDPYSDTSPTAGYAIGGGLIAGGVGLLVYSYTSLPREPRPAIARGVNRWVATETVEVEGCVPPTQSPTTSVIVNAGAAAPSTDVTERLRTLDKLKASGTINDDEYKRKRAEIVDGI